MSYKMKGFSGFKPSPAKAKGGTLSPDTKNTIKKKETLSDDTNSMTMKKRVINKLKKNSKETEYRKPTAVTPMPKLGPVMMPVMGKYGGEDLNEKNTIWKKSNQDRDTDVKLRDDKDFAADVAKYL
jgi:hypothetical protein